MRIARALGGPTLAILLAGLTGIGTPSPVAAATPTTISVTPTGANCDLQYATQDVYYGLFNSLTAPAGEPSPTQRLAQLNPAAWRVNSTTDGGTGGLSTPFPAPYTASDNLSVPAWDFNHQVSLLGEAPQSVPHLLRLSAPDAMYTGTGPLGPSSSPGTLIDQTYGDLGRYFANVVRYYNTGILATGSGASVSYTATTLTDASQDLSAYGNGTFSVTANTVAADGQVSWQSAVITSVTGTHSLNVSSWAKGTPPAGSAYNLGRTIPPIIGPFAAITTPWPRPPHVGPIGYFELFNEPDLGNVFFPRASPTLQPPTPVLLAVNVAGGTLAPGSYAYRISALNIGAKESGVGTEVTVTVPSGDNAVQLTWSPTTAQNLGLPPFAYRIYGRTSGAEQAMVVVGRDAATGLTWTDKGTVVPNGLPKVQTNGAFQLLRPHEYRRMWDVVVPMMKAVDPTIKVVGPTISNPTSLATGDVITTAITTGPSDTSYKSFEDYVQVLMDHPTNPPDVISVHGYGGFQGSSDSDAAMMGSGMTTTLSEYASTVQPYVGSTPVWHTEANDNAGTFDSTDFRGETQFDSAWLASFFAHVCTTVPQTRTLFQFEYSVDNTFSIISRAGPPSTCPPEPACQMARGRPLLSYWMIDYLNKTIPRGSHLLTVTNTPAGFDVIAIAEPPTFTKIEILVVNRQIGTTPGLGAPGTVTLQLAGALSKASQEWVIDQNTNLVSGPTALSLGSSSNVTLSMNGYGVAFVEFDTSPATNPFTTASPLQYTLASSNGSSWTDIDSTLLSLPIRPASNSMAIITGNADLWTATAGYNQDVGISVSGGAYPTVAGQPEAWKESGGFAGTFSPNAAFVQTAIPMTAGTSYTVKLQWKTNKPAAGATIFAGAGLSPNFSPTRLTVYLVDPTTVTPAVSHQQYTLTGSDGATWHPMDASLATMVTPAVDSMAIISGNADLWTANAGYNQDLGIAVSGGSYPTTPGKPEAWKESGGFAGTFSPNAAFVQTILPLTHGVPYAISLQWKTNINAPGKSIFAAAGLGPSFSPTNLSVMLVPAGANPYHAVSRQQYQLSNSDGLTWQNMDPANLTVNFSSATDCAAIISAGSDLWTATAGYNQDIGIRINSTLLAAWKESGGFAGTFSPNAAFVQTVMPVLAGVPYSATVQWKTNKAAPGATIFAGAGGSAPFSPTSLSAVLVGCT